MLSHLMAAPQELKELAVFDDTFPKKVLSWTVSEPPTSGGSAALPKKMAGNKVFLRKAALLPLKIEGEPKDDHGKQLIKELETHCFLQVLEEEAR